MAQAQTKPVTGHPYGDVEETGPEVTYVGPAENQSEPAETGAGQSAMAEWLAGNRPGPASSATATTREVEANELSTTHLDRILSEDSPLRRRAMQQGIDQAASRGLANSSIAGGNAVGALIDRATPLAQFDASAYQTGARDNQAAENQTSMFNANAENSYRDLYMSKMFDKDIQGENYEWQAEQNELDRDFNLLMQQDDQAFKQSLADMEEDLTRAGYDNQQRIAIMDAMARARSDRANLLGQGALAIFQNPKMKAGTQNQAFANFMNTTNNNIFNGLVDQFPDMPDLFPELFDG